MKRNPILLLVLLVQAMTAGAQETVQEYGYKNPHPIKEWYALSAYELIFSFGDVENRGVALENPIRFTPVFNPQTQWHHNFSNGLGFYTGLGIRNVGFISRFAVTNNEEITLKQRAYSIGLPVALKIGGMEKGSYIALGIEAECMFHYRKKILQNDKKTSDGDWFSSDVNIFNPSLFADIRFHNGTFLRFRYYMLDFLQEKDLSFYSPSDGHLVDYFPTKSTLFYISIGSAIKFKVKHKMKKEET